MKFIKFLIEDGRQTPWDDKVSEFSFVERLNKRIEAGQLVPEDTGYIGGTEDGALGFAERVGKRIEKGSGGQQDAMLIRYAPEFPSEDKAIETYFTQRTKAVVDHLAKKPAFPGGSTLISAVVDPHTHKIWCSNMGDSTAFLICEAENGELDIKQLNSLDKPDNPVEEARILKAGGSVSYGIPMVDGIYKCLQKIEKSKKQLSYRDLIELVPESLARNPNETRLRFQFNNGIGAIFDAFDKHKDPAKLRNELINFCKEILSPYPKRLGGVLSVSAGFGDYKHPAIRRTPIITSHAYPAPPRRSWLVMGCDGLTEQMSKERVKQIVARLTRDRREPASMEIAQALAAEASHSGSTDNTSLIVSALHRLPKATECSIADAHGKNGHCISHDILQKWAELSPQPQVSKEPAKKLAEEKKLETTPLQKFSKSLEAELVRLSTGFPADYQELQDHVGLADIQAIYAWLIANPQEIAALSPTNPLRFEGTRPGKAANGNRSYPLPITIHLTVNKAGHVHLVFDPNSKKPRATLDDEVPKTSPLFMQKIRGSGAFKRVRDTWTFNAETGRLEPSVASVVRGTTLIEKLHRAQRLQDLSISGLIQSRLGAQYESHGHLEGDPEPKGISFSPRGTGTLGSLITTMGQYKPDLADILGIHYSVIKSMVDFHKAGYIHRDLKPSNLLLFCADSKAKGMEIKIIDVDDSVGIDVPEEKFGGSLQYMAFDHPYLRDIIAVHTNTLEQIERFKKGDTYPRETDDYDFYKSCPLDKDPALRYMNRQIDIFMCTSPLLAGGVLLPMITIIKQQKNPIAIGQWNSPKNDVAALAKTLKFLIDAFIDFLPSTEHTPVLIELYKIMEECLHAPRASRLSMEELLAKVEEIIGTLFLGPVKGISEADQLACVRKLTAQFGQNKSQASLDAGLVPTLQSYRDARAGKDEYLDGFGRFFHHSLGYSRLEKVRAVDKLLAMNNGSPFVKSFSRNEKNALFSGELSNITGKHRAAIEGLIQSMPSRARDDVLQAVL